MVVSLPQGYEFPREVSVTHIVMSLPQGVVSTTGLWVSYRVMSLPRDYKSPTGLWVYHRVMGLLQGYESFKYKKVQNDFNKFIPKNFDSDLIMPLRYCKLNTTLAIWVF